MVNQPTDDAACEASDMKREAEALRRELARRDETISKLRAILDAVCQQFPSGSDGPGQIRKLTEDALQKAAKDGAAADLPAETRRHLLPGAKPDIAPGVRMAMRHVSAGKAGGDLYDIFDMGNRCLGIFVGDVSGDSAADALVMAIAKLSVRHSSGNEYSPKAILEKVNRELCRGSLSAQFMSAFFGVFDLDTRILKYVNASHTAPVVYSPTRFIVLDTEAKYCGMLEETAYEEKEAALGAGDHLLLFSDGLTDAFNAQGEPYTVKRLHEIVRSHSDEEVNALLDKINRDIQTHMGGAAFEDDLTLIGLDIMASEAKENCVTIPTEPRLLPRIEDAIQAKLNEFNYGERSIFAVRLAVEEAVINAMKHGNRMDRAKTVTVKWSVDDQQAVISVEDEGDGFDPGAVPDPTQEENLEVPHGRGIVLMKAYMDEVSYNERGTRVTMIKRVPWHK